MDLDFSSEQEMLRDMVRGVCQSYAPLTTVRELEDDPVGYPVELWKQLAELDLIGLMLPSQYGGSEMTMLEGALVYGEFGRSLAPTPHFVSAVMSAGAILRGGTDAQKSAWLPRIASGDAIVTTAWLEPSSGFSADAIKATAKVDGDAFVLDGEKWHVPFASSATQILVVARDGSDVGLFLVDPAAPGVSLSQQKTIASDTQYAVTLSGARGERVGDWSTWQDTLLDGIILLAAQAVGGARYALEITTQYAKDREQFDKPLGAFQAIAHYLADAKTTVDGAETLVYEAAWARANDRDVARLAPMAKLFAGKTFRDVTAMAQQIFGGVGFTMEYDIQMYFRRAKQWQISWLDDRALEEMVAADALDS